mmetsp:Transcript_76197/g.205562  ORF Transcript_76197/g.205562 Transcript_76197/m.205562 type:complete len:105 (-) Transcript_76197:20-334(-)
MPSEPKFALHVLEPSSLSTACRPLRVSHSPSMASRWRGSLRSTGHRINVFYTCWVFWGGGAHVFSDEEVVAFAEPVAFSDAYSGVQGRIKARMKSLQEFRPHLP